MTALGTSTTPWGTSYTIMPLPPGSDGRVSYAPVLPTYLSRWYLAGKTDAEVLDMLHALPESGSVDFSGVIQRTHDRLITRSLKLELERDVLRKDIQTLEDWEKEASEMPAVATAPFTETAETVTADKIESKRIQFLWGQRIPLGKLSVFCGNPDKGKSLVSLYTIAKVTQGKQC